MYNFKSKKGMKFSKLTHLTIVIVLAIVFIVVYLYYTIKDVKKIHNEVQKLTANIADMNTSISNITSTLIPLLNAPQNSIQVPTPSHGDVTVADGNKCAYVPKTNHIEDDESSVNSQELKTIMETIENENEENVVTETQQYVNDVANLDDIKDVEEFSNEEHTLQDAAKALDITDLTDVTETTNEDFGNFSVDELKKVSYEQLRKYCKNHGLSYKGTKDVLIYRIKGITA